MNWTIASLSRTTNSVNERTSKVPCGSLRFYQGLVNKFKKKNYHRKLKRSSKSSFAKILISSIRGIRTWLALTQRSFSITWKLILIWLEWTKRESPQPKKVWGPKRISKKAISNDFFVEAIYPLWISNLVLIKKHNEKLRVYINFSTLNQAYPQDRFPLPG